MNITFRHIFGGFFLLCGLLLIFVVVRDGLLTLRMRETSGVLDTSSEDRNRKDISYEYGFYGTSRTNSYDFRVRYRYLVNGVEYRGKLLTISGNFIGFEKEARIIMEKYETSDQVSVWYDPGNPAFAVLEKPSVERRKLVGVLVFLTLSLLCFRYLDKLIGLRSSK